MARLVKYDNKYFFLCKFGERDIARKAGFRWDSIKKVWYTADKFIAYKLKKYAEDKFEFDTVDIRISNHSSPGYPLIYEDFPELSYGLFKYQAYGTALMEHMPIAVLCDEMGLGKTIQAIGVMNWHKYKKVLIVCPSYLKYNWYREIQEWAQYKTNFQILETGKDKIESNQIIISYTMLKKFYKELMKMDFDLVVVDEAHHLKNNESIRSKKFLGYTNRRGKRTYHPGIKDNCKQKIFLTGTFIPNRPKELFSVLNSCAPEVVSNMNYKQFTKRFCGGYEGDYGWIDTGASNLDELRIRLKSTICIRRLKKDVLPELPDKTLQIVTLGKSSKVVEYDDKYLEKFKAKIAAVDTSAIRKELAFEKFELCIEHIHNVMESVDKLVVFAYHTEIINFLEMFLDEYNPLKIYGQTPMKKRQQIVDKFRDCPEHRIIIGNLKAMGEGVNLTTAYNMVFVEFSWVPGENEQCIDRIHRIGQLFNVLVQFLVLDGTLESRIISKNIEKSKNIKRIQD